MHRRYPKLVLRTPHLKVGPRFQISNVQNDNSSLSFSYFAFIVCSFRILCFGDLNLFRISYFGFRISGRDLQYGDWTTPSQFEVQIPYFLNTLGLPLRLVVLVYDPRSYTLNIIRVCQNETGCLEIGLENLLQLPPLIVPQEP